MAILRRDDFVQDSQGRALSGALIWYCAQPATIANPPSPLATVYSDLNGDVQAQPLVTDGMGHVAVYLSNTQLYTVVVFHPLTGLLSYPDQNVGTSAATVNAVQAIPSGAMNGSNVTFTLPTAPTTGFLLLIHNGQVLTQGLAYTISGTTITLAFAPVATDTLNAFYI